MSPAIPSRDVARDFTWSTHSLTTQEVLAEVTALAASAVAEADIVDQSAGRYYAKWQGYGLGPVDLNFIEVAAQRVRRTSAMVSRRAAANYDLLFIQRGPGRFRHCHRDVSVAEASFVLLDNEQPYDLLFPEGSVCLTAHLDDAWLRRWVREPKDHTARPLAGSHGWGAPLAAMLMALADSGPDAAHVPRVDLANHLGAMLAMAFGDTPGLPAPRNASLFARLQRVLEDRFHEPALSPADVAAAVGISKRHLHTVFAAATTSFGAALAEIRLARAAAILGAPHARRLRIGEVAAACGFEDPSYFARCFRARYGTRPRSFRT